MARKQAVETLDASRLLQKQPSCSSEEKTPWYKTRVSETTTNKPLGSKAGELILETRLSSRRGQGKDTTLITRGQKKQARRRGRIGSWLRTKRKEESAVSSFPTQDDDRGVGRHEKSLQKRPNERWREKGRERIVCVVELEWECPGGAASLSLPARKCTLTSWRIETRSIGAGPAPHSVRASLSQTIRNYALHCIFVIRRRNGTVS